MDTMQRIRSGAAVLPVLLAFGHGPAAAHDFWINRGGYVEYGTTNHCCGERDCTPWPRSDIEEGHDGFTIRSTGEFVPRFKTLSSEDGDYWICRKSTHAVRCFFTPSPGS